MEAVIEVLWFSRIFERYKKISRLITVTYNMVLMRRRDVGSDQLVNL